MRGLLDAPHPTERELQEKRIEELKEENSKLREQLLATERKNNAVDRSVAAIRNQLEPLHLALKALFGEIDAVMPGTVGQNDDAQNVAAAPPNKFAWMQWKSSLPSPCGRIIDGLLIQPLTQTQMRSVCKMDPATVSKSLSTLRANSLVEQMADKKWKLKQL